MKEKRGMKSIYEAIGQAGSKELVTVLLRKENVRVERIVSTGQVSPEGFWYDQEEDEWVMIVQGEAVLNVEGEWKELKQGDYLFLPKHCKHRVEKTGEKPPCIWLCLFWK
ncbi:cupin domain-containing protein [uncultured Sanguibacteroides sp.]|uniref:cupin domain-containing protein n=2 Tax=uncultured Sanguibacteroides sp. TaxID=1635151 RepID=UPI0025FDEB62|nr:cupin domain-containing protein [uncultured Sanguibacteroides sp.]